MRTARRHAITGPLKRQQPRLGWMDGQTVLAKPLGQDFHHALGIVMIAKANDEVIRIADETSRTLQTWSHLLLKPEIQHVVQEHV